MVWRALLKICTDETIISIPLTKSNEYADDSFITDKKQLYSNETSTSILLTNNKTMLVVAS